MSASLSAERDRIQRQVEELERSLSVTQTELDLLSSETDDGSDDDEDVEDKPAAGLLVQREKIQREIQDLEDILGAHSPIAVSDDEAGSSSDESDLGLSLSVDSCLQLNLVYQQVIQETLDQLETLLTQNRRQQEELVSQMSGPTRAPSSEQPARSSYQHPMKLFLGRFLKPYFKDKLTGLGPPANQEARQRNMRMMGFLDDKKLKVKRWSSWQKNLLIHSVARDSLKRLIQPKLSRVDFLSQKMSLADEADREPLRQQINGLEKDIDLLREKKEEELIGDRYEEHDWQKISNIDFEGTKDPEDIRAFWQNFLHPSVKKASWSKEEVQRLKEVCRKHQERHWEEVAEELGTGRTAFMCLQMFQRFVSESLKRGSWTPDEDAQLRELVDKMRIGNFIPYTQMSYFMEGRDPAQLIYRWNQVLDPSLKKGPWSREEDKMLVQAVARHGEKSWWKVRFEVPGRTDGGCRDRYLDCLRIDVKRGAFDKQEIKLLKELVEKHGVGRWSKIASEIPHRLDSQCMREWRKLNKPPSKPRRAGNSSRRRSGGGRKKKSAKKNIRKRLVKIKVEEDEVVDEMSEEEEEEDIVIPYMESDDEKETKDVVKQIAKVVEVMEQEEKEYVIPPMKEWLPVNKFSVSTSLTFQLAMLPTSSAAQNQSVVRSTILGKCGRSVIIGQRPRELLSEERHTSGAMMMVSADQLRKHLSQRMQSLKSTNHGQKTGRRNKWPEKLTEYELQAAVLPWIGHLLISKSSRRTAADTLREGGERRGISSTSIFLLFLQTMNVDIIGCKGMIEGRNNKVVIPTTDPSTIMMKKSRTGEGVFQQRKSMKQQQEMEDEQRRQMLRQLQTVEEEKLKQVLHAHRLPNPLHLVPQEPFHPTGSIQVIRAPCIGPQAAPLTPHPVSVFSMLKTTPSALPPSCYSAVPGSFTLTNNQAVPSLSRTLIPPREEQKEGEKDHACKSSRVGGSGDRGAPQETEPEATKTASSFSSANTAQTQTAVLLPTSLPLPISSQISTSFQSDCSASSHHSLSLAPPSPATSPSHHEDHNYSFSSPDSSQHNPAPKLPSPKTAPKQQSRSRKRQKKEEQQQEEQSVGGSSSDLTQAGKRPRKLSQKAKALQEAMRVQAEAKKRRHSSSSPQRKRSRRCSPRITINPSPPQISPAGLSLLPGQSMWIMTDTGLVQLAQAPSRGLKVMFVPPPGGALNHPLAPPPLRSNLSVPANGTFFAPPISCQKPRPPPVPLTHNSSHLHQPPPIVELPYMGPVKANSEKAPPLRCERLQFDPSLMFLEPPEVVRKWLSGSGGVTVPGARTALPYLPPCVSTLSMFSLLLQARNSLMHSSLQLISEESHAPSSKPHFTQPPPELPDSTSDLNPTEEQPGYPPISTEEEEKQMKEVRQLVAERFSTNPAYQLLKARFLSLFTVPALLATVEPGAKKQQPCPTNQEVDEEETEDEEELKKIRERGRRRIAERSLLLSGSSTAPASHFSGISNTSTQTPGQTGLPETRPNQTGRN